MTRPEFLSAVATLGLNPRQAMDRLGVRSLEGLNLREALESLRRQLLGPSSHGAPESEPDTALAPESSDSVVAASAGSLSASRFEEEDDEVILYALDDDDELIEDDVTAAVATSSSNFSQHDASDDILGELDELDMDEMDEVPDLSPPPAPSRSRTAPVARKSANAVHEAAAPEPEIAPASRAGTQAMRLIGKLRMATGGGPASDYQRTAYRNIVENELGRARAVALVRGLWRTTADRLTSGQMDALIRWGKEEVFAEEAEQVLAALQAEQKRAERESAAGQDVATATEPPARPRGRASGGTR